jgi:predicted transcriptional regulator
LPCANREPAAKKASPKKDQVIGLIGRKNGATLDEIMTATGWQKHTVRGFISILGKSGAKIASSKSEAGARTYKAA